MQRWNTAAAFMYVHGTGEVQSDLTSIRKTLSITNIFLVDLRRRRRWQRRRDIGSLQTSTKLRSVITLKGPVVALMSETLGTFQLYLTGVFHDTSCQHNESFHNVLISGYGDDNGATRVLTWFYCWLAVVVGCVNYKSCLHGNANFYCQIILQSHVKIRWSTQLPPTPTLYNLMRRI